MTTTKRPFQVGDYAVSLETGWLGQIVSFEPDGMAKMIGVDTLARMFGEMNLAEAASVNDVRWFAPADLIRPSLCPVPEGV